MLNENKQIIKSFQAHDGLIASLNALPNGNLVSTSSDSTVKIWDTTTWNLLRTYTGHTPSTTIKCQLINCSVIASAGSDASIHIWNVDSGLLISKINVGVSVVSMQKLANGLLASGHSDGCVKVWFLSNGTLAYSLIGHVQGNIVYDLALVSDRLLASISSDQTVRIWDLLTQSLKYTLAHGSNAYVLKAVNSNLLASSGANAVKLWDMTTGSLIRTLLLADAGYVSAMDMLDMDMLVVATWGQNISYWQVSTGRLMSSLNTGVVALELLAIRTGNLEIEFLNLKNNNEKIHSFRLRDPYLDSVTVLSLANKTGA